jgi:DNA invertase Pin-like site-specific DNA recombinase
MTTRVAIYARFSSENQREESIEDQVEVCRRYVEQKAWSLEKIYADHAVSGGSAFRDGYQQLLADIEVHAFDIVVCEALDRLGRKLSDVADLHDRLEFHGIELHAVNIGVVTTMHVGLLGVMAQIYLSDLRDKTKRGQLGRALAGKIPGGKAFGYDIVDGKTGERRINRAEAVTVQRIFRDYGAGKSPRAIAKVLNAEAIPGPEGREWRDTTIRGQPERGTGILNNALYAGRIEWNRCSYVKNPKTGKRVARPNPKDQWEVIEIPHLRIVDDELWNRVKVRQRAAGFEMRRDSEGNALNRAHRRKFLFSGRLKCRLCGASYTIMAKDRYGCADHRTKGTCSNASTVSRLEIERRVLGGLKDKLMAPELIRAFVDEFQAETNRLQAACERESAAKRNRLETMKRKITAIVSAIEDGNYNPSLTKRLTALEEEQTALEAELAQANQTLVLRIHPRLSEVYAVKVAKLEEVLNDRTIKDEAGEILRGLIDRIEIAPRKDGQGVDALLHGDLAQILAFCEGPDGKKLPGTNAPGSQLSVVAGARNRLYLLLFAPRLPKILG